ncbi:hypothetical protein HPB49_005439 [Dermacentor silvarum]|uniref:Uncharacterized protein n=1 Tax=Dermacentor silvarum TaxID=543639 RepID=A0ACB8DWA9_DERSI|nr:hypothetical protein HPB49_005439 [Dermacentor silvarum]
MQADVGDARKSAWQVWQARHDEKRRKSGIARPITPSPWAAHPLTDALPGDAEDTADTANCDENRQRGIGEAASSADTDDSGLAHFSDAQPPRTIIEAVITSDDLFDDEQSQFVDAVSESGCSSEDSNHADEERSDPANGPVPQFNDTELLAQCVRHFGNKTLPSSSTALAEAVVLIMAFVVAHGLTWDLLIVIFHIVYAFFCPLRLFHIRNTFEET